MPALLRMGPATQRWAASRRQGLPGVLLHLGRSGGLGLHAASCSKVFLLPCCCHALARDFLSKILCEIPFATCGCFELFGCLALYAFLTRESFDYSGGDAGLNCAVLASSFKWPRDDCIILIARAASSCIAEPVVAVDVCWRR